MRFGDLFFIFNFFFSRLTERDGTGESQSLERSLLNRCTTSEAFEDGIDLQFDSFLCFLLVLVFLYDCSLPPLLQMGL